MNPGNIIREQLWDIDDLIQQAIDSSLKGLELDTPGRYVLASITKNLIDAKTLVYDLIHQE